MVADLTHPEPRREERLVLGQPRQQVGEGESSAEPAGPYGEAAANEVGFLVGEATGLELVDVDCAEDPCLLSLAGRAAAGADLSTTVTRGEPVPQDDGLAMAVAALVADGVTTREEKRRVSRG